MYSSILLIFWEQACHCKNLSMEVQWKKLYKNKLHDSHSHLFKILFTSLTSFIMSNHRITTQLPFFCGFGILVIIINCHWIIFSWYSFYCCMPPSLISGIVVFVGNNLQLYTCCSIGYFMKQITAKCVTSNITLPFSGIHGTATVCTIWQWELAAVVEM